MGHRSNAVDKYQITSDEQRQKLSEIIGNEHTTEVREVTDMFTDKTLEKNEPKVELESVEKEQINDTLKVQSDNIGPIIASIVNATKSEQKSIVKINIEIINE